MSNAKSSASNNKWANMTKFAFSSLYRHLTGFVTSLFRPALLGPELFGIWTLVNMIPFYANFAHLGARAKMRLALAQTDISSDDKHAMAASTQSLTLVVTLLLSAVLCCVAFLVPMQEALAAGLYLTAGLILLNVYFEQRCAVAKGEHNFSLVSKAMVLRFTLNCVLSYGFIVWLGIYGAFLALIVSAAISVIYLKTQSTHAAKWQFDVPLVKNLIKQGAPITGLDMVNLSLRNFDKLAVGAGLGATALGYYGIAGVLVGVLINVPGATREVSEQLLMDGGNSADKTRQIEQSLVTPMVNLALLVPFFIGAMCFTIGPFLSLVMPTFAPSEHVVQLLLLAAFWLILSYPCRGLLVLNNWQKTAFYWTFAVLVINVLALASLAVLNLPLEAYAAVSLVSYLLLLLAQTGVIFIKGKVSAKILLRKCWLIVLPYAWLVLCYLAYRAYLAPQITNIWLSNAIALSVFSISYTIILVYAVKQNQLVLPVKIKKLLKRVGVK